MGTPRVVVGLRVSRAEAVAPHHVIRRIDNSIAVEVSGHRRWHGSREEEWPLIEEIAGVVRRIERIAHRGHRSVIRAGSQRGGNGFAQRRRR